MVANADAAARMVPLGFTNVTVLDHGKSVVVAGGRLKITATEGARLARTVGRARLPAHVTLGAHHQDPQARSSPAQYCCVELQ